MKISIRVIQVLVAVLFIISGLVKANDPLGLSYKMEEFFEIWNSGLNSGDFFAKGMLVGLFNFLHNYSLALSIIMITLEIVAGFALLIGWKKKPVLWLLLVLIVFFTFLTGYAYLSVHPDGSPKFTNCGCFGDCLPITPKSSFLNDIALLAMIMFLLAGQKYLLQLFSNKARVIILSASLFLSLLMQWYVLNYLPFVDCLPFKKGKNITEQMKQPPGSYGDSTAIRFIYEKDGKRYEWDWTELPADYETYTYVDRIDKLVRKGNADP
ncbi:MAG TPA: MauE/DoxX family redox-associated membrane protein, partial [Flavisolibacter sp.]